MYYTLSGKTEKGAQTQALILHKTPYFNHSYVKLLPTKSFSGLKQVLVLRHVFIHSSKSRISLNPLKILYVNCYTCLNVRIEKKRIDRFSYGIVKNILFLVHIFLVGKILLEVTVCIITFQKSVCLLWSVMKNNSKK